MGYSNSSLVSYTKISPCNSGQRTHTIDRITPHCVVGQCSIQSLGSWFSYASTKASSNYGIDKDGKVGLFVEERNRSWCTSSSANDNRAVTIECASDTTHPYTMHSVVYETLVKLCTDICRRNGKTKLLWFDTKNQRLNYNPAANEMVITVHRDYANKACPGDWLYSRLGDLASRVTKALGGSSAPATSTTTSPKTTETIVRKNIKMGDEGDDVKVLQQTLNQVGNYGLVVDGIFGSKTKAAVLDFQQKNGLDADGICGPITSGKLDEAKKGSKKEPEKVSQHKTIRKGDTGEEVKLLQSALVSLKYPIGVDGIFGIQTYYTVINYQNNKKLDPDGIVGPLTWASIDKDINK